MKNAPELDPELRGLLEEIAADPRSRMRLAPRRALRSWCLGDEPVRPRDLDGTVAERHLVEAHREALAALLREASSLAYWLEPETCSRRPSFAREGRTRERVESLAVRVAHRAAGDSMRAGLLAAFQVVPDAGHGRALAESALALVPASTSRLSLAFHMRRNEPRAATQLFRFVGGTSADADTRSRGWSGAGATQIGSGDLAGASASYEEGLRDSPAGLPWAFNVAMCRGSSVEALEFLRRIEDWKPDEGILSETVRVLGAWLSTPSEATRRVRDAVRKLRPSGGSTAERILNAYV